MNSKECTKCKEFKPLGEFYKEKRTKSGLAYECKECSKKRMRLLYEKYPEMRRRNSTKYKLKTYYGLTPEDRIRMLEECGYKCEICSREVVLPKPGCHASSANIDHCHTSGKVRGILCGHCNKGLGHFSDSMETMKKAITYLEKNSGF